MGMIQTLLKATPEGQTTEAYCAEVENRLPSFLDGETPEHSKVWVLSPAEFDENWQNQENIKADREQKYRDLTAAGRVVAVEIDW